MSNNLDFDEIGIELEFFQELKVKNLCLNAEQVAILDEFDEIIPQFIQYRKDLCYYIAQPAISPESALRYSSKIG